VTSDIRRDGHRAGLRRAGAVLGTVLLASVMAACNGASTGSSSPASTGAPSASAAASASPAAPVHLDLTVSSGGLAQWYLAEVDRYKKVRPEVDITVNAVDGKQWQETLKQIFASSDRPDIADVNQGPDFIPKLAEAGLIAQMDDVMASAGLDKGGLSQSTLDFHRQKDGHYYGLPNSVTFGPTLFLNKALFTKAGVPIPASGYFATQAEFLDACGKFRAAGIAPISIGEKDQWPGNHTWSLALQSSMTPDRYHALLSNWHPGDSDAVKYTDPDAQGAFDFIKALQDGGCFIDGANGLTYDQARAQFAKGGSAMWQGLSSSYGKGDLLGDLPADFDLDVALYPQLKPDVPVRVQYYAGHTTVVATGTDAAKVNAAKEFAAFVTSVGEQEAMPGLDVGILPARVDIDPKSLEPIGPIMSKMYEQLARLGTDDFYDVRASTELSVSLMYGLVQEVIAGTKTPAEAAKAMEDKATALRQGQ
jgi:raffinose/stachyose/melibiose transport system substrate-binding protein